MMLSLNSVGSVSTQASTRDVQGSAANAQRQNVLVTSLVRDIAPLFSAEGNPTHEREDMNCPLSMMRQTAAVYDDMSVPPGQEAVGVSGLAHDLSALLSPGAGHGIHARVLPLYRLLAPL